MTKRGRRLFVVIMCIIFTLTVALPLMTSAQLTLEWVVRYNGPGNNDDIASAIAIDLSGNIYVTGQSWGDGSLMDYATVKYDTNGKKLWVKRYDGPGSGWDSWDRVHAIAIDSSDNIYVTGSSQDTGTEDDYATVKYDTNGNQLWVKRYNGLGNDTDYANAIVLDSLGNSYVTGWSKGSGTGFDYATVNYDTNGYQKWVARYNGLGNGDDKANAIAIDSSGNIYVTGSSEGILTLKDYSTVKYDNFGSRQWVANYYGEDSDDVANAIALDSSGNIYVTGSSKVSGTLEDYVTVKYDTYGNLLWVARYNGPGNGDDQAFAIVIDSSGNSYVTGWSQGSGTDYDYATVKYDTNGNQLWVERYNGQENGDDRARAIAIDSFRNIYVTGSSEGSTYVTVIYDKNGKELCEARYNDPDSYGGRPWAIALDPLGYIYVTGNRVESGAFADYATIKYTGLILWVDFSYVGTESGTFTQPYNTLEEAHSVASPGQIISIKAGETGETGTFDKKVRLVAHGGTVTIGK